jgi:hypothetical protein
MYLSGEKKEDNSFKNVRKEEEPIALMSTMAQTLKMNLQFLENNIEYKRL